MIREYADFKRGALFRRSRAGTPEKEAVALRSGGALSVEHPTLDLSRMFGNQAVQRLIPSQDRRPSEGTQAVFAVTALRNHSFLSGAVWRVIQDEDSPDETTDQITRQVPAPTPAPSTPSAPATVPVHPTSIAATRSGARLNYGSRYTHTLTSSDGNSAHLAGVLVGERVTVARDDFGLGWGGVALGSITATCNAAGRIDDSIGTPAALIDPKIAAGLALPAVLDTPQTLHWRDPAGAWQQFAAVGISFTLRRGAGGRIEGVTTDNGISVTEASSATPTPAPPSPVPSPAPPGPP